MVCVCLVNLSYSLANYNVDILQTKDSLMAQYKKIVDEVIDELDIYDRKREELIALTRKLNRASGRGIAHLRDLTKGINELMEVLGPITSWSTTSSGTEEYCELEILHAITKDKELPSPAQLLVPSWIWISALGDVIGELRRLMLTTLTEDLAQSKLYLEQIRDLYDTIVGLDFSKSLVPNLRRKIDVARSLIERCESDYANAVIYKQSKSLE